VCAIGAANFDIRSFSINYEAMAVLDDAEKARKLAVDFENDLKSCERITWKEYPDLPPLASLAELNHSAGFADSLV
jgi:cardiolipin synthase